ARFAELYERHFPAVYAYVSRRVPDRTRAEDLTSDVFHKALAALPRYESRGAPFAAWLYRIASNEIADFRRRSARDFVALDRDPPAEAGDDDADTAPRRAFLSRSIDDLPADQRRVVLLRFFEQQSIREIATELGRTPGAVKQLQF